VFNTSNRWKVIQGDGVARVGTSGVLWPSSIPEYSEGMELITNDWLHNLFSLHRNNIHYAHVAWWLVAINMSKQGSQIINKT